MNSFLHLSERIRRESRDNERTVRDRSRSGLLRTVSTVDEAFGIQCQLYSPRSRASADLSIEGGRSQCEQRRSLSLVRDVDTVDGENERSLLLIAPNGYEGKHL